MDQTHIHLDDCEPGPSCSRPLHVKRIEKAVVYDTFLNTFKDDKSDDSSSDEDNNVDGKDSPNDYSIKLEDLVTDSEAQSNREFFNFASAGSSRTWLSDILQEESDTSDDSVDNQYENLKMLLKIRSLHTSHNLPMEELKKDMYYSSGLLSNHDKYIENKRATPVKVLKKKVIREEINKSPLYNADILDDMSNEPSMDFGLDNGNRLQNLDEDSNINSDIGNNIIHPMVHMNNTISKRKTKKFKDEESKKKWEDMMTIKRRKIFTNIVKKEINKQHRVKMNKHKELLIQCKRVALQCQKTARQKALQSSRIVKEQPWRIKRLARENIAYWKRSKRVDREIRRKLEKEAEEQRKMDFELIEAKRQQRKLNFLITQTELYAHFMSKKLGKASPEEQLRILSQLDEEKNPRLSTIDDYDCEFMKAKAKRNAQEAFENERARTRHFDMEANSKINVEENFKPLISMDGEHPQPSIFRGILKGYQLRGMNWLANLYDQGISGILADEMGLGKTVQSIAFLCHIAERNSIWGPFLIISPASTLHNWQQEIAKFVPEFKVVPYWGNPNERKILRQFWDQKDMHTKDASFHVVITSYQIVISDIKYFNRIKWQYMILDEAQAIKSTSSMRWKTLLGFNCRNRLLLSGTPIQNSMAELWALLHFIMPTLFDSHEEFNEWFSKDIESHAENKTGIDEKHLSRLHMILKPFMLRRIKKDVENELSDKIEVMTYCPLTTRQKLLYMALKQKIRIEDLLHYTVGGGDSHVVDKNFTSNLMNLVMQFRKVCNHPELFERRDAKSPFHFKQLSYNVPALVYDYAKENLFLRKRKYFAFYTEYIAHTISNDLLKTIFFFCISLKLSSNDLYNIFYGNILHRWKNYYEIKNEEHRKYYNKLWNGKCDSSIYIRHEFKINEYSVKASIVLKELMFTWKNTGRRVIYTHTTHFYHSMPETVEHRNIRHKMVSEDSEIIEVLNDDTTIKNIDSFIEHPYEERPTRVYKCQETEYPSFVFCSLCKVETQLPITYCYSRRAVWDLKRHIDDFSWNALNYFWQKSTKNDNTNNQLMYFYPVTTSPVEIVRPMNGWSHITIPDKETLVTDSGKLSVLDGLLRRLKEEGHRVLIYSQMTKMIDLLEEYMWHRHHKYMRLDGSSKISERRDMVADFQARTDIFVFLLSTRAGGLGINLTAADTVIFYDSDWNPTVDQQAMDRAHRLGQTKQVTVYRLICKGSIEERILQRAREKSEIQKLVISGGNFKPDTLKPKEVVSLLLDDEELEQKYRQRTEERKHLEDLRELDRKRKHMMAFKTISVTPEVRKVKIENASSQESGFDEPVSVDSVPNSPRSDNSPDVVTNEDGNDSNFLDVEGDTSLNNKYTVYNLYGSTVKPRVTGRGTSKRGRPRGSRRVSALGRFNTNTSSGVSSFSSTTSVEAPAPDQNSPASSRQSPTSSFLDIPLPSTSTTSPGGQVSSVRRGPGRPRLKPGPPNRGSHRPRKPARPLPVPLPSDSVNASTSSASVSNYSSYLYDFPEQTDT